MALVIALLIAISGGLDAGAPAVRVGNAEQVTPTEAPPSACEEMSTYRQSAGLPARFDRLGYRESRCGNAETSPSGCCVGYWQLSSIIWRDHRMVGRLAECGATWANVRGTSDGSKRRQACAARALFEVDGYSPWAI